MSKTEWKEYKLGEITDSCLGKMLDAKKNRGIPQPYLANVNVRWGSFDLDDLPLMRFEESENERYGLKFGDIVVCEGGEPGRCAIWKDQVPNMKIQKALHRVRCHENVDYRFLYYYLLWAGKKGLFDQYCTGSTIKHLPGEKLKILPIRMPPLAEQQRIVKVLSSLDDKIELNNAINRNLEAQAQALFKNWFIDFEPFGGKMPEEWKIGKLGDIIERTINGDWGKDEPSGSNSEEVFCIRGADIPEVKVGNKGKMPTRYIITKNYQQKKLEDGDLVVEISGGSPTQSTGRVAYISKALLERYNNKIVCTNFCKAIKPKDKYNMLMYFYWQYLYDKGIFFNYENGTTGIKNLDISGTLGNEKIVIPSQDYLKKFNNFCEEASRKIFANGTESEILTNLRDNLLIKFLKN